MRWAVDKAKAVEQAYATLQAIGAASTTQSNATASSDTPPWRHASQPPSSGPSWEFPPHQTPADAAPSSPQPHQSGPTSSNDPWEHPRRQTAAEATPGQSSPLDPWQVSQPPPAAPDPAAGWVCKICRNPKCGHPPTEPNKIPKNMKGKKVADPEDRTWTGACYWRCWYCETYAWTQTPRCEPLRLRKGTKWVYCKPSCALMKADGWK